MQRSRFVVAVPRSSGARGRPPGIDVAGETLSVLSQHDELGGAQAAAFRVSLTALTGQIRVEHVYVVDREKHAVVLALDRAQ